MANQTEEEVMGIQVSVPLLACKSSPKMLIITFLGRRKRVLLRAAETVATRVAERERTLSPKNSPALRTLRAAASLAAGCLPLLT